MDNLLSKVIEKYGVLGISIGIGLGITVWTLSHLNSEPGTEVKVLWGMTSYTTKTDKIPEINQKLDELKAVSSQIQKTIIGDGIEIKDSDSQQRLYIDTGSIERMRRSLQRIGYVAEANGKPIVYDLPPVLALTLEEASYFKEACETFREIDKGEYTLEEVEKMYPGLTRQSSCDWKIIGLTFNGWLDFQQYLDNIATLVERLSDAKEKAN